MKLMFCSRSEFYMYYVLMNFQQIRYIITFHLFCVKKMMYYAQFLIGLYGGIERTIVVMWIHISISTCIECYSQSFLHDGQGAVRRAVLSAHRSYIFCCLNELVLQEAFQGRGLKKLTDQRLTIAYAFEYVPEIHRLLDT